MYVNTHKNYLCFFAVLIISNNLFQIYHFKPVLSFSAKERFVRFQGTKIRAL